MISINKSKINQAAIAAKILQKKFNLETVPVDVKKIAQEMNIVIEEANFENENISGYLKRKSKEGNPLIVVRTQDLENRKRFTIAHELGHYILHKDDSVLVDGNLIFRDIISSTASDIKEIQANQFASELLMPTVLLLEDIEKKMKLKIDLFQIIKELAYQYGVSNEAMTIKVGKLIH